ncbi:MAG: hypothetical protein ACJ790_05335, partial [Myxococcaceae bacterium]
DTLYRAGECEDAAAGMLADAADVENRSFGAVSDYEEQRFHASETWYRLGAAERSVEERRELLAKSPGRKSEELLQSAERTLREAKDEYEREESKKNRLWDDVEKLWERSAEVSLLVAEQKARGRKIRKEAESLFQLAEERKNRGKALRVEAEAASVAREIAAERIKDLLTKAKEKFGCAAGADFLYFRQKENPKLAFCVPLVEDRDSYNVEVKPLSVYSVEQKRGIAFLEPARGEAPSPEEGDRRFEEYFLKGRRGREAKGA